MSNGMTTTAGKHRVRLRRHDYKRRVWLRLRRRAADAGRAARRWLRCSGPGTSTANS